MPIDPTPDAAAPADTDAGRDPAVAPVVRTAHLEVDEATAWDLVGSEVGLARWLGAEVEFDPTVGGALRLVDDDGTVRTGRVTDVDDGRSLSFTWASEDDPDAATTVTIAVGGTDRGTAVTVVEARASGRPVARMDAGAAWDHRLLHLELGALAASPLAASLGAPALA